jgi:hypothetical protein
VGYSSFGKNRMGVDQDPAFVRYNPAVVASGSVVGGWRRDLDRGRVIVKAVPLTRWSGAERDALLAAARRYGAFMGRDVICSIGTMGVRKLPKKKRGETARRDIWQRVLRCERNELGMKKKTGHQSPANPEKAYRHA